MYPYKSKTTKRKDSDDLQILVLFSHQSSCVTGLWIRKWVLDLALPLTSCVTRSSHTPFWTWIKTISKVPPGDMDLVPDLFAVCCFGAESRPAQSSFPRGCRIFHLQLKKEMSLEAFLRAILCGHQYLTPLILTTSIHLIQCSAELWCWEGLCSNRHSS